MLFVLPLLFLAVSGMAGAEERRFVDLNGNAIRMSELHGKWVVVNYWASWCPPCLEELPELVHFHETHKDDKAVVIGINAENLSRAELLSFVDEYMLNFPIIPRRNDMPGFGPVPGLPTTFLIDPEGNTVARQVGPVTAEMIENFMASNP
ncbi:MAG: TlpA family protein disulfide reductase [Gammaproteobacteria bacterium]|nr:TlpA family protein disulfide reductase [Gammaproteobacteria bacterium]